jgi:hypothetical protein
MDMTMIMIGKRKAVSYDKLDLISLNNASREKDRDDPNSTKHSVSVLDIKPKPSKIKLLKF